jgi:hypothetical protein
VTNDDKDAEEKRLHDELTAACAEMGMYDDEPAGPPPEVFHRFCICSPIPGVPRRRGRAKEVLGPVGCVLTFQNGLSFYSEVRPC